MQFIWFDAHINHKFVRVGLMWPGILGAVLFSAFYFILVDLSFVCENRFKIKVHFAVRL